MTSSKKLPNQDEPKHDEQAKAAEEPSRKTSDPPRPSVPPDSSPRYENSGSAAAKLGISPAALRARCRRAERKVGDSIVAALGGGIKAFKFGRNWLFTFPPGPLPQL